MTKLAFQLLSVGASGAYGEWPKLRWVKTVAEGEANLETIVADLTSREFRDSVTLTGSLSDGVVKGDLESSFTAVLRCSESLAVVVRRFRLEEVDLLFVSKVELWSGRATLDECISDELRRNFSNARKYSYHRYWVQLG